MSSRNSEGDSGEAMPSGGSTGARARAAWGPAALLDSGRSSGILLHPTSLPGDGIGDLGQAAYRFVDWLAAAGQSFWQILPLVDADEGGSPYNGLSAMAGNPLLIDLADLVREGLLTEEEIDSSSVDADRVDFPRVNAWKGRLLAKAHRRFRSTGAPTLHEELQAYRDRNAGWLEDYALFRALRRLYGGVAWTSWAPELRRRDPEALRAAGADLQEDVSRGVFQQFLMDRHWAALRGYARERGIAIIGDIPIFVSHDSADVWANQPLFQLREDGRPEVVSGVPPDYFSATGQRWGNPLYRWDILRDRGYAWWVDRFRRTLEWVDLVRVDHFRGFESYWEIPAEEETAERGRWRPGPGAEFFRTVQQRLGALPVIAEDLGLITEAVDELRAELGYPGMRVVQFAFDGDPTNPHLPENYPADTVAYTGTHDNDTVVGWWSKASPAERAEAKARLPGGREPVHEAFLKLLLESRARLVVAPVQDVLGLGSDARMNTPGTNTANWTWRLRHGDLIDEHAAPLRELTLAAGRVPGAGGTRPDSDGGGAP
jgi:4-alpha-glucanotransferase